MTFPLLETLRLTDFSIDGGDLAGLGELNHLRRLRFSSCVLEDALITEISNLKSLEELEFINPLQLGDQQLVTIVHRCPQLKTLKLQRKYWNILK